MVLAAQACAANCGTPMDQVLVDQGWDRHPGCEFPDQQTAAQARAELLNTTPKQGKGRPATPRYPRRGSKVDDVYRAIADAGERGAASFEIEKATGHSGRHVAPILHHLTHTMGCVAVVDGKKRETPGGAHQPIYRAVPRA